MKTKRFILMVLLTMVAIAMNAAVLRAQDAKVIKIASQSPLSGGQALSGTSMRNAIELAIADLKQPLVDLGFDVQYVPFDDQATPDVGVSNAQNMVNDPAILVVIGHWNSGVAIPSSEVYNTYDLAMISPANTNPRVTSRGLSVVNRVCGRDDNQGPTGAKFLAGLGTVKSVYVLHDKTPYGQGIATFFQTEAEAQGIAVLGFEGTEEKSNFDGIIQPILATAPDAIYFGGIYDQTAVFLSQARAAGYTGIFMGPDGTDASDFAALAGEAAVGTYYTSAAGPLSVFPDAAKFVEDYNTAYGENPQPYGPESYDATAVALHAIQVAIELNGGELPSRAQVAAAVRGTADFQGLTGPISFDAYGDRATANYYVSQVKSGDPALWSENELLDTVTVASPFTALLESAMGQ
ncbi:MAG: branched-chain amino acid ABC transporter substrate-binding protein [Chloroflexi bacterium]|nr:branched-chain amino acid ABC transporter substrate-binding protein [Chloroflexota bacterium]